jgi:putative membrane protein
VHLTLDAGAIGGILLAEFLYLRAVAVLRRRGYDVPRGQQVLWHTGIFLELVALVGPLDSLAEDLLSAHMSQHLLIADIGAPLLLAGLRTPMLVFFLPRAALVRLARMRRLRSTFRTLRKPLVAIPVWIVILYGWHFAILFEAALNHWWVHALQHASFVFGSILVWWAVIDPKRRRMRGELWKAGQIMGSRVAGMFLGMAFIIMSTPAYAAYYGDRAREYGMSPVLDQQIAGGIMFGVDILIMFFALGFFFWRAAADNDRDERTARDRAAAAAG